MGQLVPQFQTPGHTSQWLEKLKPQMALAIPKHMSVDRMARLALTAFSANPQLAECSPHSVAASIMTASQLGLEPNVNGQGYLIPYKGTCTFVPGWKGLVDLANRGGRCTVWTGAVYKGDDFDYCLGDNPFVRHKPGDEVTENYDNLLYVYAIGRIKGQDVPVIEVWRRSKVDRHLQLFNKVGGNHYALKGNRLNYEMYARKVPLLQVLKYMPQSIELTAAMEANRAADEGRTINIDGATWVTTDNPADHHDDDAGTPPPPAPTPAPTQAPAATPAADAGLAASDNGKPALTDQELAAKKATLLKALAVNSVNDVITSLETRNSLTRDQKMEIASWIEPQQPTTTEGTAQ
jgi:recombination protein RecT